MGEASPLTSYVFPQSVAWETHLTNVASSMWFLLVLSNIFPSFLLNSSLLIFVESHQHPVTGCFLF